MKQLQRARGKSVICIMGFCPQYLVDFGANMGAVQPEDSKTLTDPMISWIVRNLDCEALCWDMRPDCKKKYVVCKETTYRGCAPRDILETEAEQLFHLNDLLHLIITSMFPVKSGHDYLLEAGERLRVVY